MKKIVSIPYIVWCHVMVDIDAEEADDEEYIHAAFQEAGLQDYGGNGASFGKLVGTDMENVTVEACDESCECDDIPITVRDFDPSEDDE